MEKSELRKLFLERRRDLAETELEGMSGRIADRFFDEIDLTGISAVHTYVRIPRFNEVDTSSIYAQIWREHKSITTYAPKTEPGSGQLECYSFDPTTRLIENVWGIPEPSETEKADPKVIDLVIVPLLCFDQRGHRVGYGKGYYDRFLSRCRADCLKVGLSFFPPIERIEDIHEADIPLDLCITPDASFGFASL